MNKEMEYPCCNNCKYAWLDRCEKMRAIPEFAATCGDEVQKASDYLENFSKRLKIKQKYCCNNFENRWLEYPIAVKEVKVEAIKYNKDRSHKMGALVKIRPCGDEYNNKTFLGFYLGDLPLSIYQSFNPNTNVLEINTSDNPAIFVPEIQKIVFGCESWWGEIKSEDELKEITDETISNQWYVRLLKGGKDEN